MPFPLTSWVWRLSELVGWLLRMLRHQFRNRLGLILSSSFWWRSSSRAIKPASNSNMERQAEEGLADVESKLPSTEVPPSEAVSVPVEESLSVPAEEAAVPCSEVRFSESSARAGVDILNEQGGKRRKYHTDAQETGRGDKGKKKEAAVRPNHFIAFRVSNEEVWSNVQQFQEKIISRACKGLKKPDNQARLFKETFVSVHKLHFTLHVMALESEDHKKLATQTLDTVFRQIKEDFSKNPVHFSITGLGHFRNNVLFAKILGDEHVARLEQLAALVRDEFGKVGLVGDSKSFKPHMTVAKMSKAKRLKKRKMKAFPIELWNEDENMHFGHQTISSIELLSMQDTDPTTKYYKALARFSFPIDSNSNPSNAVGEDNKNSSTA